MSNVNNFFEKDESMKAIKEEISKSFHRYQKTLTYMIADAPLSVLCLNKSTEKFLISNGFLRVYDIIDLDLTKVKGITDSAIRDLTSRLNEFISMI